MSAEPEYTTHTRVTVSIPHEDASVGDRVMTLTGSRGRVTALDDDTLTVLLDSGRTIRMLSGFFTDESMGV